MQFRFRRYNKEEQEYELVTYTDVENYNLFFQTLTFMKEHHCTYAIEVNKTGVVESNNVVIYEVEEVSLCISKDTGDDGLVPHFVVDITEAV